MFKLTAAICLSFFAAPALASDLYEISPGLYVKDHAPVNGWRVQGVAARDSRGCYAAKAGSRGDFNIKPLGVIGGKPLLHNTGEAAFVLTHLQERQGSRPVIGEPVTRYAITRAQWRRLGERFLSPLLPGIPADELTRLEGARIDLDVATYEYPSILAGYQDGSMAVDLTGVNDALFALKACEADLSTF